MTPILGHCGLIEVMIGCDGPATQPLQCRTSQTVCPQSRFKLLPFSPLQTVTLFRGSVAGNDGQTISRYASACGTRPMSGTAASHLQGWVQSR